MTITAQPTKRTGWFTVDHTGSPPLDLFLEATYEPLHYPDRKALWSGNLDAPLFLPAGSTHHGCEEALPSLVRREAA